MVPAHLNDIMWVLVIAGWLRLLRRGCMGLIPPMEFVLKWIALLIVALGCLAGAFR